MTVLQEQEDVISVPVWWKSGGMMYNRSCLSPTHPESTYSYIKNVLHKRPEDFGVSGGVDLPIKEIVSILTEAALNKQEIEYVLENVKNHIQKRSNNG